MLRIRSIARLTGVREATLRAWERRYGFPLPERGENGYRSYSQNELERIRRVASLMEQGFSASEAIGQVRAQTEPDAWLPDEVRTRFWDAAKALDSEALEQLLTEAAEHLAPLRLCDEVLLPLLREMSERLDIAREHLASSLVRQRLGALVTAAPVSSEGPLALLACSPFDAHEGGLLALALHLKVGGYRVSMLGADTPVTALEAACRAAAPDVVGLSFVRRLEDGEVAPLIRSLNAAAAPALLVVGGSGIREHLRAVAEGGGHFAESAEDFISLHRKLANLADPGP